MANSYQWLYNPTTRKWDTQQYGVAGATSVYAVSVTGVQTTMVMTALATPGAYPVPQKLEANLAAKSIRLTTTVAMAAAAPVLVGWSTSGSAGGAIGATLDLLAAELVTPTAGQTAFANTKVLASLDDFRDFVLEWDGEDSTTKIRSIAVRSITTNHTIALDILS